MHIRGKSKIISISDRGRIRDWSHATTDVWYMKNNVDRQDHK